ncbi:hypothetical protein XAC3810_430221 [Xanthomonas citri pv. citri]|nr:hypothetical protein XAC9322_450004 [Xanthomonas citri pv. citri]CEE28157.1 hypothetical protein XAC3824_560003 [Xanthomonas citri pv. citri]CEE38805.1 hypothetical protein XAC3810_430221 [Xanthomonas citri pv. citri]CEE41291.1 hypothetical protein XAC902_610003 [Xanthomonas citri pv. citri]CEE42079.1 hypothetical protein XAC2911_470003 [Xanthomonas citri pv. citri]
MGNRLRLSTGRRWCAKRIVHKSTGTNYQKKLQEPLQANLTGLGEVRFNAPMGADLTW